MPVMSCFQGGLKSSGPEALTAYVLVSLLESGDQSRVSSHFVNQKLRPICEVVILLDLSAT